MKKLVVIETKSQAKEILKWENLDSAILVVCNFEAAGRVLTAAGIEFKLLEGYEASSDTDLLDEAAFSLAGGWHQIPPIRERLLYRDCSLGFLIERDLTYYLFALLYNFSVIDTILRKEKPDKVIVFENPDRALRSYDEFRGYDDECIFGKLFRNHAKAFGIPVQLWQEGDGRQRFKIRREKPWARAKIFAKKLLTDLWQWLDRAKTLSKVQHGILLALTPDYVLSLAKILKNAGSCRVTYLTRALPFRKLKELLKSVVSISIASSAILSKEQTHKKTLLAFYKEVPVQKALTEYFSWNGYNLWPYVSKRLEFLFSEHFIELRSQIDFFIQTLTDRSITTVVVNEDVCDFNRTLVVTARNLGIPSVVLQHGVAMKKIGFYPVVADRFACWGSYHRNRLLEWGIPQEKIVLTGCPRYEEWPESRGSNSKRLDFCRNYGLDPEKKIVVYVNTILREEWKVYDLNLRVTSWQMKEHIEGVVRAMKEIPDHQLVIKLHPRDRHRRLVEDILNSLNIKSGVTLLQFCNTRRLLEIADVVIDPARSGMSLEALALGRPLVRLNLNHRQDPLVDLNENGVAVGITELSKLPEALEMIKKLHSSVEFKERLRITLNEQLFVDNQTKPSHRVASLVLELSTGLRDSKNIRQPLQGYVAAR